MGPSLRFHLYNRAPGRLRFHLTPKPKPPQTQTNFERTRFHPICLQRPRFHPNWGPSKGLGFTQFVASRAASVGLESLRFHPIWGSPKSPVSPNLGSRGLGFTQFGPRWVPFHPIWGSPKSCSLGPLEIGASRKASVSSNLGLSKASVSPNWASRGFGFTSIWGSPNMLRPNLGLKPRFHPIW